MIPFYGFSLPSLLLSLGFASLIMLATSSLIGHLLQVVRIRYYHYTLTATLQQQLNQIAQEVKRAGFRNTIHQPAGLPPLKTPIVVGHHPGESINSCLLFYYDRNRDNFSGYQKIATTIGYRLHQGNLETQHGVNHCQGGRWEDLFDKQMITIQRFQLLHSSDNRWLQLTLQGKLTQQPQVTQQRQAIVALENLP